MGEASQRLRRAKHDGVGNGGIAWSTLYDEPPTATDDTAMIEAMSGICEKFERYLTGGRSTCPKGTQRSRNEAVVLTHPCLSAERSRRGS